ncbi:uncharacterized protein F13E9.13, mitochondrial isoform X1 [Hippocampus zosterae]|uniref:uncharacterized protein F13E9.13, mitochondrial isoform X1 n=1 Tax=Hippocampus zosterae TaxID=109293 RepID=UPI00223E2CA5|nr:uncharacterized protein F13E9.13, mitochondrial isoform X1 [Hippocampus zosterae]
MKWLDLFGRLKCVVIGMIHVKALPGSPLGCLKMSQIIEEACWEASVYRNAGLDGVIVENMHDVPYSLSPGPEVSACMTSVCAAVRNVCPSIPVGVQILSAANRQALAVALASGAHFIRAEGFVFSHVADEGLVNACAGELLRYRKSVGAEDILVLTDIKKKHSSHALTSDVSLAETARAAEFFLSDGLILTGKSTGAQADPKELTDVMQAVSLPVLVGSGVTHDNVDRYLGASGLIVGSHFKSGGSWSNALNVKCVNDFMTKMRRLRESN